VGVYLPTGVRASVPDPNPDPGGSINNWKEIFTDPGHLSATEYNLRKTII
jgi:hypothetical protein